MTYFAETDVPTEAAYRYAKQLGKYWVNNFPVGEDGEAFLIAFPKHVLGADWSRLRA